MATLAREGSSGALTALQTAPSAPPQRPPLVVEVADAVRYSGVAGEWRDLVGCAAEPNVFMEPGLVSAASECDAEIRVLLAWGFDKELPRLVGAWALRIGRAAPHLPLKVLTGISDKYAFLGTPVVDRDYLADVPKAMLDTLLLAPDLPKTILARQVARDGPTMTALREHLHERGGRLHLLEAWTRPILASPLAGEDYLRQALSSGSRKKLRQHRNRLERQGALAFELHTASDAVSAAFEQFVALEAAGWKGRGGTDLASRPDDLRFARSFLARLAEAGLAWLVTLTLNGQPIAIQVMLRSGPAAFTWKTAFDERFADFSPGVLLLQEVTRRALADPQIAFVDSCSHEESGYMADMWQERQTVADICFDARPGHPAPLRIIALAEAALHRARLVHRRLKRAQRSR